MKHLLIISVFIAMIIFGYSSNVCDSPDYIYWPDNDSIGRFSDNVTSYYNSVDTLEAEIEKIKQNKIGNWRDYYAIYLNYEYLEKLSHNNHPMREKYYREMKDLYINVSIEIRRLNIKQKTIKYKYKF